MGRIRRIVTSALLGATLLAGGALAAPGPKAEERTQARTPARAAARGLDAAQVEELLKRIAPAEGCNGGSCQMPTGTILNCPTSGGSSCGGGSICTCQCYISAITYSWTSGNICMIIE
jgi:hypothetical protein